MLAPCCVIVCVMRVCVCMFNVLDVYVYVCARRRADDNHVPLMAAEGLVAGLVALLGGKNEDCKSNAAMAIANLTYYNGLFRCHNVRLE